VRRALEELAGVARGRLERHPQGHRIAGSKTRLELQLTVPLGPLDDDLVERAEKALEQELATLLDHHLAFRPGRVFCLRCGSADCEHAASDDPRHVFAGYGPSGLPRFEDFGQWLLERSNPHIDRLYQDPPRLVTDQLSGKALHANLLPAFRDKKTDYRLHGQVTAGWFRVPRRDRTPAVIALTFQVLSSAGRRRGRRLLGLNLLGRGPEGESLGDLYDRLDHLPWRPAAEWAQEALESVERGQARKGSTAQWVEERIEGILGGIARRLHQGRRARDRRTGHAQKRHESGKRPTNMALVDLSRAKDDSVLYDERRQTLVVLGSRGRAHVWSPEGKLVTSIRYSPESIEKKKRQEIWRQAKPEEVVLLRKNLGLGESADG
jgi:hypothetical protein